ncbi:MAG: ABC transporter ATP-binding protein [Alphaproteobacteria bacterium]|nr:ABC transporter ATP-binding protein [Alphaproteobacteria bacterium]
MYQAFKIFFRSPETSPLVVLGCLVLASLAEAVGLGTLLPVITAMSGGATAESSAIGRYLQAAIESTGLTPSIGTLVIIVVVFLVAKAALTFAALSYAGISSAKVSIGLRRRLVSSIFNARWSFFGDQRGGKFANTAANDAGRAGDAYWLAANVMARCLQVIAYAVIALLIDWRLALLGFAAGLFIGGTVGQLIRVTKRAGYKQTDRTSELTVYLVDLLANIKPLKAMQRQAHMLAGIGKVLKKLKRALVTRELAKVGVSSGNEAVGATLAGAGLYFAHVVLMIPLPELMVSGLVFFQIMNVIGNLQKNLQTAASVESAYVRTEEMIADAIVHREVNTGRLPPDIAEGCRFEDVNFAHGETAVVSGISFDIPSKAITVLRGPSGSGKTTIIDLLIGLHKPDAGRILVGGTPLSDIDIPAWRRMIGYVPQELSLFHTSIRENITLGDDRISDADVIAALSQAGAGNFIDGLPEGLDTDVGEMGGKLSGGQRQRISLARALVGKPQVLILDEVTSALDPETEAEIVDNIANLRGAYTIIAITHRPAWTKIADRLYTVSSGRVTGARPG